MNRVQRRGLDPGEALDAVKAACAALVPQLCMCDTQDVGAYHSYRAEELPALFLYDSHPGGCGPAPPPC